MMDDVNIRVFVCIFFADVYIVICKLYIYMIIYVCILLYALTKSVYCVNVLYTSIMVLFHYITFNNSGNKIVIINHNKLTNKVVYHTHIHTLHYIGYITLHYIHYIHTSIHPCMHTYIYIYIYIPAHANGCQNGAP
jgi:hypothetical protein